MEPNSELKLRVDMLSKKVLLIHGPGEDKDKTAVILDADMAEEIGRSMIAAATSARGYILRPTLQNLHDVGLNPYAFELVSESLAGKKDIKTFKPLRFAFKGVIYTLEPEVQPEQEPQNR